MSFDITRLSRADRIVGGGGVAFFIFLFFFKWYGVSSNLNSVAGINVGGSFSWNGWHAFTNSRWIWLLAIIVAIGSVVLAATQRKLELPIQPGVLVAGLGALSTVLIFYRIVHHPTGSASVGSFHASVGIKIGIWLGLLAAAAVTYGGYLKMQEEGTSLADVRDRAQGAFSAATAPSSTTSAPAPAPAAPPAAEAAAAPPAPPPAGAGDHGEG
jgi:hypothetical protein